MTNKDDVVINSVTVDAGLLEVRPMRRCQLDECQSYCCSGGVYIAVSQAEDIRAHAERIQPHLPEERRNPAQWFAMETEPDDDHPSGEPTTWTNVIEDATHPAGQTCIFLRPDRLCALQAAGIAEGEHPWRYKPYYCALHPLVWESKRVVLAEESEMYLEGGNCNRPNPSQPIALWQLFDVELQLVLGDDGYKELARQAGAA